ncbi:A/G-specific adenine glycosylase [Candidatus Aerophobetes bacterium]|uniref:Adenine DNA glycosylase n=1 Tax=Aerophobetes bacterium TaxID=2030807 RepID=A0A2A4X699_UNCAE|nr:MAG: A/G-specific adenine glycosylase [Candidatus Aerophobetes bacterium]
MSQLSNLKNITLNLSSWFSLNKRDLPWRHQISSYGVWVSEVMLQQTQVVAVVPYFKRWMEQFSDIEALALANSAHVLKMWEGLGYYSRARRLHQGAKDLYSRGLKDLPRTREELLKISGIGEYTAGAILCFAWKKRELAIDGNVARVITRLFDIETALELKKTKLRIKDRMQSLLNEDDKSNLMESVIEFGALVCKKQPLCSQCPLKSACLAYKEGKALTLPVKQPRRKTVHLHRLAPILISNGEIVLEKRGEGEVMEGLYEFPYHTFCEKKEGLKVALEDFIRKNQLEGVKVRKLEVICHYFTRYKVMLYPALFFLEKFPPSVQRSSFYPLSKIKEFTLSSGHKKIWDEVRLLLKKESL